MLGTSIFFFFCIKFLKELFWVVKNLDIVVKIKMVRTRSFICRRVLSRVIERGDKYPVILQFQEETNHQVTLLVTMSQMCACNQQCPRCVHVTNNVPNVCM